MSTQVVEHQDTSQFGPLLAAFEPAEEDGPDTEELFCGAAVLRVQAPAVRNDYKKRAGSSDGGKTYDTTAV